MKGLVVGGMAGLLLSCLPLRYYSCVFYAGRLLKKRKGSAGLFGHLFMWGISIEKSKEMGAELRKVLKEFDKVSYVMTQVGRDDEGAEAFSLSHIECGVGLKPYSTWKYGKTKADLIEEMNERLTALPGYSVGFSQPIIDMVMDQIAGTHSDLALKIYGDDISATRRMADEVARVLQKISGAQFENQHRAYRRLGAVVPLVLGVMLLLLFAACGKFRQAALMMSVVPLALFGGMLALNVRGMTLNVSSAVGFIALIGVAIQNGVIMISHINNQRSRGRGLKEAVVTGTRHRFRLILMTATVAILGLLPASVSSGIGSDVQRPLATVIVYGLLFATVITLYMLPALYYLIERRYVDENESSKVASKEGEIGS